MPLPLIPVVIGLIVAGGSGVAAGADGVDNMNKAKGKVRTADESFKRARSECDQMEASVAARLARYGKRQARIQATTLAEWVAWLEANRRKVRQSDHHVVTGARGVLADIPELKGGIVQAGGLLTGGASAVLAGVAAQQAALMGVRTLATAGTGAAISGLSGAAAESATMAWLGGGTLASGGAGVAGGAAVLGGVAVAPALLIAGLALCNEGEKALSRARKYEAEVDVAIEQISTHIALLDRLLRRADEMLSVINRLNRRARRSLAKLAALDFDPIQHTAAFQETALLMRALVEVLDTPLLDENGEVSEASLIITERYAA